MSKKQDSPLDSLPKSIHALQAKAPKGIHIRSLRFPNYRNLQLGAVLPFEFQLTALLGRNGTNKSSILHALYGSAAGNTVGEYWFETKVDAIPETVEGMKQSVVHSYEDSAGRLVECIKARAPRGKADPDYWEAVKPSAVYGFPAGAEREPPISLEVKHLDFRGVLPAFDKYFYFPDPQHLAVRIDHAKKAGRLRRDYRKQDYLRNRSPALKKEIAAKAQNFTEEELNFLRYILEREYAEVKALEHSLFHGHEGWTVVFKTKSVEGYTEAFAGSGEAAAAHLVHQILAAPDGSLILLDEPETSLHPGAQQRVLEFLAHQAVRKSLQIVMATHSIYFADGLPQEGIRVFEENIEGRITITTKTSAKEAFHVIGTLPPGKAILVEDERAKAIVLASLEKASPHALQELKVSVREGGTSSIFLDMAAYSKTSHSDVLVVLDGDHRPETPIPESGALPQGEADLRELISKQTRGPNAEGPKKLPLVGVEQLTHYLEYIRRNVHYLPGKYPEELVWSDEAARKILGEELPEDIDQEIDAKAKIIKLAKHKHGLRPDTVFDILLSNFLDSNSTKSKELADTIEKIRKQE